MTGISFIFINTG